MLSNDNKTNDTAAEMTTATATTAPKKKSPKLKSLAKTNASILTKTTYFTKIVNAAFDSVDVDKSGDVTLEELYSGLLLIHLKMAIYVGAPACRVSNDTLCKFVPTILSCSTNFLTDLHHSSLPARSTSQRCSI